MFAVPKLITQLLVAALAAAVALASVSGCSGDDSCADVTPDCAPLYPPTFDNVFQNTLMQSCSVPGSACHAAEGAQAGVVFADIDASYELLTGAGGRAALIDAESLGCGTLLSRVGASDPSRAMPPSAPLSDSEICAITQWVSMGAPR